MIYILAFINLLVYANKYGKPNKNYNFWSGLLGVVITLTLTWWAVGWVFW